MKALIFAAGVGSRLKPWTDRHPKALVDVGGKPMLQWVIERIIRAGITDIIINVHHFAGQIIDFIERNDFNARITVSDETDLLLETGGALRKVVDFLENEPVLIHNADILSDFDISSMILKHGQTGADISLLVSDRSTSRYLVFENRILRGWKNISTGEMRPCGFELGEKMKLLAFDGVHIINPSAFPLIKEFRPAGVPFSIIDFYLSACDKLNISAYELPAESRWYDVGKPGTLAMAREFFKNNI